MQALIDGLEAGPPDAAARRELLAAFWAEVEAVGTPLIERSPAHPGGERVIATFLWRFGALAADRVMLQANRLTDPDDPEATVLRRVPGTDVGHLSFAMEPDWRASYQFAAVPHDADLSHPGFLREQRAAGLPDPLARRQLPARKAVAASSVVELPEAPAQPWRDPRPGTPAGELTRHVLPSAALGEDRVVWLYAPPARGAAVGGTTAVGGTAAVGGTTGHPTPGDPAADLLVLLDGDVWSRQLPVAPTLDNLIAAGRIPPTVAVMPESARRTPRWNELACEPAFTRFLVDELLPWARAAVPHLTADPRRTTLAGQSLGGLTALHNALLAPDVFGRALSQSGSLWWPRTADGAGAEALTALLRSRGPRSPSADGPRLYVEVGAQEWMLTGPTRRFRDALVELGHDVVYREFNGGHDHACWIGGLADGLVALAGDDVRP